MKLSRKLQYGMTLIELLVVMSVTTMLFIVVMSITVQMGRIHAKATPHIATHMAETLAFKRMQRELRETRQVIAVSSTQLEFVIPDKTSDRLNNIAADTAGLHLQSGKTVRYFLGVKQQSDPNNPAQWVAQPTTTGTDLTLFRTDAMPGQPISPTNGPFASSVTQVLIEHIKADQNTPVFTRVGRLVTVTLTMPVQESTPQGRVMKDDVLSTRFLMRNLPGS